MHKRTLHSLLIVSFIVVFAASLSLAANNVNIQTKNGLPRCFNQSSNVTADLDVDVSAVECVFVITSTSGGAFITNVAVNWGLPTGVLSDRYIDLTKANGVSPDTIRFAAMRTGETDGVLTAGTAKAIATITFRTSDVCNGAVTIAGIAEPGFNFPHPTGPIVTQFVEAATDLIIYPTVNAGTIGIANQTPVLAAVSDQTVVWGHPLSVQLFGSDPDAANGCETATYSFVGTQPTGMTLTGDMISWTPTGDQICNHVVEVKYQDKCGANATQTFNVLVTNQPPVFTDCPTETIVLAYGQVLDVTLHATDPDGGPYKLYNLVSFDGPGLAPTVTKESGNCHIVWNTDTGTEYQGTFTLCVEVTDDAAICDPGSPVNATQCCFEVMVIPYMVQIEKLENAYLGQIHQLDVNSLTGAPIEGFDILLRYDPSVMSFISAEPGDFIEDCGWEYFTYRFGENGNCGVSACPSGVLRVVALAESSGGNVAHHPICWAPYDMTLFTLNFLLSTNANFECQFAPVDFVWYDCADNGLSSLGGEYLYVSEHVYRFSGFVGSTPTYTEITGQDITFPTITGVHPDDIAECRVSKKGQPEPWVRFYTGGFDIPCADSIDARGDINLNHIAYEVADAVMFTNYFVNGPEVAFAGHEEGSVQASDCNADGVVLSVADLVYLIRVIIGDALPIPKTTPVAAQFTMNNGDYGIDIDAGAAYLVFAGDVTPTLLAPNVNMQYAVRGGNTHVIVVDEVNGNSFTGTFLHADGRLISSEIATRDAIPVVAKLVPTEFAVAQNYPNPFNPTTTISFQMPQAGTWSVDIYNIAGQRVQTMNGSHDAGYVDVEWDASNLASGVYFYKVVAGKESRTMKAILLK